MPVQATIGAGWAIKSALVGLVLSSSIHEVELPSDKIRL